MDGITNVTDMSLSKLMFGDSEGQGSWGCCIPWGHKELDMTVTEEQQPLKNLHSKAIKHHKTRD